MPTTRISLNAHKLLLELAEKKGESMQRSLKGRLKFTAASFFLKRAIGLLPRCVQIPAHGKKKRRENSVECHFCDGLEED